MGSKRKFKRDYIILEAKDINFRYKERVLPKAFAKVEVNDEKSIIALYVENLKYVKDGYKAVAIKGDHGLIDLGNIILNEQGRGEFVLDLEDYDEEIKGIALLYERNIPLVGFKGNKIENYEDILFQDVEDEELAESEEEYLEEDIEVEREEEYLEEDADNEENSDSDEEYIIEEYDEDEYEDYWEDDETEEGELKIRADVEDSSDDEIEEFNNYKEIENYNKAKENEFYDDIEYEDEYDEDEEDFEIRHEEKVVASQKTTKSKKTQKEQNNVEKVKRANGINQIDSGNKQAGTLLMPRQIKKGLKLFREVKPFTADYIDNTRWWKIEVNPTTLCGYSMPYLGYLNVLNYTMYSDAVLHSYKYRHYLFGVQYDEYNKRKHYIYAIPGNRNEQPDNGSTGFLRYQACDHRTNSLGYWLCFIDSRQRSIVR
ncbi:MULTISPECIES: hypothetical protein [unclassified Clostridioides]|uniref:hypothetical protein n=1 Tax=unclassified Clostridioides TaxID=2635829 RepID=UPI001D0C55DC|nr:hypothetical protein [Clostridioides sp. ES-S-0001-02]MCC0641498.1 hypothetical protein [Clostridioides sp. ES-S-0049-03]MCC0671763.1 hypothetical protein [Clostridioides sp. ES-S-0145-01]MCC0677714.1 hypothetical protein [Clostridioides sp. ES-W-0018-02]MCC0682374.1 hypothetical protein [Clostridioides sp. ES-S-0005-03]MCC0696609.1 hypothetical protein [Clostridioides sp. ES-S-0048-02]MCC0704687.1 hypothetical protein [Clostridioides sp. ES-S-0049-02]MCC0705610.1 hypothetical protein [Cl